MKTVLAGAPNCGKTTLYNAVTGGNEYVGNWTGVTVDKKEGKLRADKEISVLDLPGTYSLVPHSPEEDITRCVVLDTHAYDVIVNVIDGTKLERSLFLTLQLLKVGKPIVLLVNFNDILKKSGVEIDFAALSEILGVRALEISALKKTGLTVIPDSVKTAQPTSKPDILDIDPNNIGNVEHYNAALSIKAKEIAKRVIVQTETKPSFSDKVDKIVTNKWLCFPILAIVMFFVYFISISTVGAFFTDLVNEGLFGDGFSIGETEFEGIPTVVSGWLENANAPDWLSGLLIDGIIGGAGAVLGFVPQIFILFLLLSMLEDSGYMARAAFVTDRFMRAFGLSGKSFIPAIIGTGCGVPAIMSSRTIENERCRRCAVMTTTFIPCSAKMPIIALVAGIITRDNKYGWAVAPAAYLLGVVGILLSGIILGKLKMIPKGEGAFIMELPEYHLPDANNVWRNVSDKTLSFVKRATTFIMASCIIIWFLSRFGFAGGSFVMLGEDDLNGSLLYYMCGWLAVLF
ncbi:MAG: ferrous iron transporter B, partial [Oscillospiraceae bacterium]|nr:ferrous iron transporter B [Oscillospiraceae bacterium]